MKGQTDVYKNFRKIVFYPTPICPSSLSICCCFVYLFSEINMHLKVSERCLFQLCTVSNEDFFNLALHIRTLILLETPRNLPHAGRHWFPVRYLKTAEAFWECKNCNRKRQHPCRPQIHDPSIQRCLVSCIRYRSVSRKETLQSVATALHSLATISSVYACLFWITNILGYNLY